MKSKKIFIKIVGVILCIIMVVFVAVCCYIRYDIVETENLIINIHHQGGAGIFPMICFPVNYRKLFQKKSFQTPILRTG